MQVVYTWIEMPLLVFITEHNNDVTQQCLQHLDVTYLLL